MKHWVVTISLALLLVGGGVFGGLQIVDMTDRINELELDYATLNSNFDSLQSDFQVLEVRYLSLGSDYTTLLQYYGSALSSNSQLQYEIDALQRVLDQYEKVPHSYYSNGPFFYHPNTRFEFVKFLTSGFTLPRGYEANVFDCSESAAYVEWALENAGFDAYIAVGPTPWDPTRGSHAWVIVDIKESGAIYRIAIEATEITGEYRGGSLLLKRIPSVARWNGYYEGYDAIFQNIYQVIRERGDVEEWDWWE